MWLFNRKKREKKEAIQEEAIQAVRQVTLDKIDEASKKTDEANELLERGDVAYLLFLAKGGNGKKRNGKA